MNEKVKEYIKLKGKNDLNSLFNEWDETTFMEFEIFASHILNIDLNCDTKRSYELIDKLTFKTNKEKVLKELYWDEERTKEDLINLMVHCENINELIKMELENFSFGTILNNEVIIMLEDEDYLVKNNLLRYVISESDYK